MCTTTRIFAALAGVAMLIASLGDLRAEETFHAGATSERQNWPLVAARDSVPPQVPAPSTTPDQSGGQPTEAVFPGEQETQEPEDQGFPLLATEVIGTPVGIGGQYRVMFNAANFSFHSPAITDSQRSQTFFNQRFRTWLTVTPNEHVQGYLQVQMGHNLWGDQFEFVKTDVAPLFPVGTRVGIALRRGYLAYRTEDLGELRVGVQDWQDSFGQTLASSDWDFNVGGLSWARTFPSLGNVNMLLGLFALSEGDVALADDALLLTLDLEWHSDEDHALGLAAYFLPDSGNYSYPTAPPYDSAWDAWLGVRARGTAGRIPLGAFFLYNPGQRKELTGLPRYNHHGFAAKLESGPLTIGPGKWSTQILYSSGKSRPAQTHSHEFRTIAQSVRDNFGAQGYWSYLVLTSPHGPSDVDDLGVSLQNRGLGLFTVQTKYDYPIAGRLSGAIAVGWLRSASQNPANGATGMGTELANMFLYDFGGGLKADFGVGVFFPGDFYRPSAEADRPDTLYEAFARVQLEF